MMDNSTTKSPIELALEDLDSQKQPNYAATARKFAISRTTLSRRHRGVATSRAIATSETKQRLTNDQEEVLIRHINKLTDRGMPPTSQIVRNLAEEIIRDQVGKNWVGNFVQRRKNQLKSCYLRGIDKNRKKAEYEPMYQLFYDLVK